METSLRKKEPAGSYRGLIGRTQGLLIVRRKERAKAGYPQEIREVRHRATYQEPHSNYRELEASGTRDGCKHPQQTHGERIKGPTGNYGRENTVEHI